jgi:periplasmic protein TonB
MPLSLEHIVMRLFITILFSLNIIIAYTQDQTFMSDSIFIDYEEMAKPEGGLNVFMSWINENNQLMDHSDTLSKSDRVYVQFKVDTSGHLNNAIIVRSLGAPYDQEALRLINECPIIWTPTIGRGRKIVTPYTMPIVFRTKHTIRFK